LDTTFFTVGIDAFAGNDIELCGDEDTPLAAIPAPIGSTGVWTTTGGATIVTPSLSNSFVTDLQPGANTFTWTLSNAICGDFSSDEVTIFFEPSPIASDDAQMNLFMKYVVTFVLMNVLQLP